MNSYQITYCRVVPGPRSVEFVEAFSAQGAVNRFRVEFSFVEECGGKILQVVPRVSGLAVGNCYWE